ncbi:ATP-binding protein [Roseivivax sp. CAU 1753]
MTLSHALTAERRARLAAEKLLAQKHKELMAANRKLGLHTRELAQEVYEARAQVASMRSEHARVATELDHAVQKIEVVESHLWQALEAIRDGFALFNPEGALEIANSAYLSVYDGLNDVGPGTHYRDLITVAAEEGLVDIGDEPIADWTRRMEASFTAQTSKPQMLRLWDGRFIQVQNRRTSDDGIVSLVVDMTELMRMWSAVQELPDGFVLYDPEDRMVMCNDKYRSIYAKSAAAMVPGATFEEILRYGLRNRQYLDAVGREEEWLAERMANHRKAEIVLEQPLDDGRWLRIFERRISDGSRVGLRVDITDLKNTQANLETAIQRAEAANRAKSAFLANMSHEIRTPMNGVVSMSELLMTTGLDDEQRLYAETIQNSGEALLVVINDLLDFSKIEADRVVIADEPFDLECLVHDLVTLVQGSAREKGLSLLVDYDIFLPSRFSGDANRLRQVFTNLIGNAIKFTDNGQILIRIIGLGEDDGRITLNITVEDTGIGIPPAKTEHIFGVFNQVEEERDRAFEGTGLGLAITKRLVELMGGEIWVDSTPGEGSCFGFRVVLGKAPEPDGDERLSFKAISRVLVADPHAGSRAILARQLGQSGIAAIMAASAEEASAARSQDWQVAILADDMGGVSGSSLAAQWRAKGEKRGIILSVTLPDQERATLESGVVQAVLKRPAPRATLYAALARISPIVAPDAPTVAKAAKPKAIAAPAETPDLPLIDMLLAEDNKTNQLVFSKMVGDLPVRLRIAENGREALDEIAARRPDLVFMDISMPGMDGKEATRRLRAEEARTGAARLPVIAVTAHAMTGDREAILAEGLDDFVTKPVRKAAIRAAIEAALPGRLPVPAG